MLLVPLLGGACVSPRYRARVRARAVPMFFDLAKSLRSLTISPAAAAIRQAHGMAQRRLAAGGATVPASKRSDDKAPADFVLPADVDASAVAAAIRNKLGVAVRLPDGGADSELHPLERRLG